jgi:O-acetyl-ADP-ribose deacetylase (regulator of RNase III)
MTGSLNIHIRDVQADFIQNVKIRVPSDSDITVEHQSIFDTPVDALVSPANSYGFMDGGIDALYSEYLGWGVQSSLQAKIKQLPGQELLIGQALVIPTHNVNFPYLIAAPTMRYPRMITDPNEVFLATRAAIIAALNDDQIGSVAIPGMGTGCGRLRFDFAAIVMLKGIQDALSPARFPQSWQDARDRHLHILE